MFRLRISAALILVCLCASAQQQPPTQMPPDRAVEKTVPPSKPEATPGTKAPAAPPAAPATQQSVAPSQSATPEIAKPESDRGDESVLRQQPETLGFRNPNREQLQQKIQNALRSDPNLQGSLFTVNIGEDAIDLSGNAQTPKQRLAARRIVQSFAGNLRVRERISVAGASPAPGRPEISNQIGRPPAPGQAAGQPEDQPQVDANRPHNDPKKDGDKSENPR
jgi:hypothetical protein